MTNRQKLPKMDKNWQKQEKIGKTRQKYVKKVKMDNNSEKSKKFTNRHKQPKMAKNWQKQGKIGNKSKKQVITGGNPKMGKNRKTHIKIELFKILLDDGKK